MEIDTIKIKTELFKGKKRKVFIKIVLSDKI